MSSDQLNSYSSFKILHHVDRLSLLQNKQHPVPISFRLVISDLCNQNCHFCTFRMENSDTNKLFSGLDKKGNVTYNPKRFLDKEKCLEIIKDAKDMGVKSIEFTGGGEPTVHPDHIEIFKSVLDSGIDLGLITNGVLFRKGFIENMLKSSWVRFSIDAGKAETYSKIRQVPLNTFDRVFKNIKKLVQEKKQNKSDVTIGVSFIVTDENYSEIYESAKKVSKLGVDYFRIGYYRTDDGFTAGDFEVSKELIEKSIKDFSTKDFKVPPNP